MWCCIKLLRVLWTPRRFNQSILKEISPEYSMERLMLKLKLQCFGHLMWRTDSWKDPDAGKDWKQEEKGMTEDEMVGWHHRPNGHEFELAPEVGDGQGGLVCCRPGVAKSQTRLSDWTDWTDSIVCNYGIYLNKHTLKYKQSKNKSSQPLTPSFLLILAFYFVLKIKKKS